MILSDIDSNLGTLGPKYITAIHTGYATSLSYYNVLQQGNPNFTNPSPVNPFDCLLIPPVTPKQPNFTTGALTQGIMAIQGILTKSVTTGTQNTYYTNFTIVYRANSSASWQLATCLAGSPSKPAGGTIGNFNELEVFGSGATAISQTYWFDNVGEYAVRNNGLYGNGCNNCDSCASFTVNYYDAGQTQPVNGCTECSGPGIQI